MTGFYPYHPFNKAFLTFHGDRKDMIDWYYVSFNPSYWAGEMVQFIKSLAVQPENLN